MQEKSKPVDNLRADAEKIITRAIAAVLPDAAVERALKGKTFLGRVYLVAAGKAAWQMAHAARACLQDNFCGGVVVTKYGHVNGEIADVACFEGGHPVPDENSLRGTDAALALTEDLTESDTVVFLLSGGGSALFEKPLLPLAELQDVTNQLLAAGADIVEINTIRKRLSAVKGGRFARHCAPAQVFAVVLSDILGDPLDMIASGPAYPDSSSCAQALDIAKRYGLRLVGAGVGASGAGDAENAYKCRNADHRQRARALRGGRRGVRSARLRADDPHRLPLLRGARGGEHACFHCAHACA